MDMSVRENVAVKLLSIASPWAVICIEVKTWNRPLMDAVRMETNEASESLREQISP